METRYAGVLAFKALLVSAGVIVAGCALTGAGSARADQLEQIAQFNDSMPTGVTVSQERRIFVNFPRWGDPVPFTVAEVRNGKAIAYPDQDVNRLDAARAADAFVSVQSVVVDPRNRLWALDTGSIRFAPVVRGGAKLVGIDLTTNRIIHRIRFPAELVLP